MNQKLRRILALAGAVLLFGMYVVVLILGLTGSEATNGLLMAAIACTVIVPVLLYAMQTAARMLGRRGDDDSAEPAGSGETRPGKTGTGRPSQTSR